MDSLFTVPGAEASLLIGKSIQAPIACLLLHGFTCQPEELRYLAEDLHRRGCTVLSLRLAGHGTTPSDLARVRWTDWLASVEDGLAILGGVSEHVFAVGQSMGGMLALTAAACYPLAGVVSLSTPYAGFPAYQLVMARFLGWLGVTARKNVPESPGLGQRRAANYPAYVRYPVGILPELGKLQAAMLAALPQVKIPALVVQSRQDVGAGLNSLDRIYTALGSSHKEKLWLDGFDHSMVRDEKRAVLFEAIYRFLHPIA